MRNIELLTSLVKNVLHSSTNVVVSPVYSEGVQPC